MKIFPILLLLALVSMGSVHALTDSIDGGGASHAAPTATAPVWGKLVVSGNDVTCYYGTGLTTPATWTQIGAPVTINFINNQILVGIFITSHNANVLSTGTIDNLSITPTPTFRLADSDIGAPSLMGSANLINGVWTISGSGADIWGTSDQFNFQPWLVGGDCTIICRVTSISAGDPWQKIGIMVRDGYNSGSDYVMFCATLGNGVNFLYRTNFNDNNDATELVAPATSTPGAAATIAVGYSPTGSNAYVVRP